MGLTKKSIRKRTKSLLIKVKKIFLRVWKPISQNKILSLIFFLALALRVIGLIPNNLFHQDEPWVEVYSGQLAHNIITKGDFDPHTYKYGSFIFYLESIPHFFIYPTEYVAYLVQSVLLPLDKAPLMTFGKYVTSIGPPPSRILFALWMQRFFVAIIGALSILVLYKICLKLFNKEIALLSAFFFAIMPLHVRDSHYLTTDIPLTFFTLVSILFMIKLFQTGKLKWYIISGLMIGYSSTVRFFPLALLPFPIAILYDKQKGFGWLKKIFLSFLAIALGVFIGVPFLILNPNNVKIFNDEMSRWVLPWYTTTITIFLSQFIAFIKSSGHKPFPPLSLLLEAKFNYYYVSFLFNKSVGIVLMTVSLIGLIITAFKYTKAFFFLSLMPVLLFIYISSYIKAGQYERLAIPLAPFIAIYAAVTIVLSYNWIRKNKPAFGSLFFALVVVLTSLFPFYSSFTSSWACGQESVSDASEAWIMNKIPDDQRVAIFDPFPYPSSKRTKFTELGYYKTLSFEETRQANNQYVFINKTNLLNYVDYLKAEFFITPSDLYENNYAYLTLYEYAKRAKLINEFSKPDMCAQPDLLYYAIPNIKPGNKTFEKFEFEDEKSIQDWKVLKYSAPSEVTMEYSKDGHDSSGSLKFSWTTYTYTLPRIISKKIPVAPGKTYTLSGWIKIAGPLGEDRTDGYLRADVYSKTDQNMLLPGISVALSPRAQLADQWERVSTTFVAPQNASFAVISLGAVGFKSPDSVEFDDIQLSK